MKEYSKENNNIPQEYQNKIIYMCRQFGNNETITR